MTVATGHKFAGPTAGSYTSTAHRLTDRRQADGFVIGKTCVIYADEQSKWTETSKQVQYTKYANRETANTPVLGVSSCEQSNKNNILTSCRLFCESTLSGTFSAT